MKGATITSSPAAYYNNPVSNLLTPKDVFKPTADDDNNKWFTISTTAKVSVTFKQKLTIDAIGFETGGDDTKYPTRTPRTVRIGYYNNGYYAELGMFSLEDLVGLNYAKR